MYKIIKYGDIVFCIHRIVDQASIPLDTNNRDYREYLEWIAAGNTPEESTGA